MVQNLMTLSRRDALKYTLSASALAGLGGAAAMAAPLNAFANGPQLTEVNVVNVKDYGATGDGATDDTAAIHSARDAGGVGAKITIPPGTYIVSGLMASVADQTWELSDDAVIKMKAGAASTLLLNAAGVSVVGGVFDGSNGMEDDRRSGIQVKSDGVTIRNATIQNSSYYGIAAYNHNRVTISGCTITNNKSAGIFVQNSLAPPSNIHDISITDNLVDNSSAGQYASGIGVRGNSTTQQVKRVTISRNTVRLPYNQSGETGAISVTSGTDWVVENNLVFGGFMGITCPNPTGATISNNVVLGFSRTGIEIPGAVESVTIMRNLVDPDGTFATVGIQASAGAVNGVHIVGNTIKNFSRDCYLISFVTDSTFASDSISKRITIDENLLTSAVGSGSFSAVYFNGSVTNLTMSGNIVDGSSSANSSGVRFLKSVLGASVTGNHFANLTGAAVLMAASGLGYTLDYINVVGNAVVNCGATLKDATSNGAAVGTNIVT